jgi:hypothetical protein
MEVLVTTLADFDISIERILYAIMEHCGKPLPSDHYLPAHQPTYGDTYPTPELVQRFSLYQHELEKLYEKFWDYHQQEMHDDTEPETIEFLKAKQSEFIEVHTWLKESQEILTQQFVNAEDITSDLPDYTALFLQGGVFSIVSNDLAEEVLSESLIQNHINFLYRECLNESATGPETVLDTRTLH